MTPGLPSSPQPPAPQPRGSALVPVILGIALALVGVVLLARYARQTFREEGGVWSAAEVVGDQFTDSVTEAGIAFPERDLDDPLLRHRTIVVSEGMNERTARTVVRKLLFLNAEDPTRPIDLYLSTAGGWYDSAFAIVDTIRLIDAPVNTIALGGCHSAGAVVLISGTGRRSAAPDALISVHADVTDDEGPYALGVRERERVERTLRGGTKLPAKWFPLRGGNAYYLTPEEALSFGIIDEILPVREGRGTEVIP